MQSSLIEALAEENLDLYPGLVQLFAAPSENSIVHVELSADQEKVVAVALLTLVFSEIGFVLPAHL